MVEVDLGARIARHYNVYLGWEHAQLGGGATNVVWPIDEDTVLDVPSTTKASTDFLGVGLRFSTDPDHVGLIADLALGFRRMVAEWDAGEVPDGGPTRLTMSQAPLEFRFGLGADIRLSPLLSLSPMATIGSGIFRDVEYELTDGSKESALGDGDEQMSHGWVTVQLGGHFDIGGRP